MKKILILLTLLVILNNCAFFKEFDSQYIRCDIRLDEDWCIDALSREKYKLK